MFQPESDIVTHLSFTVLRLSVKKNLLSPFTKVLLTWVDRRRLVRIFRPPSCSATTFLAWFLLSNFSDVQRFSGFYILNMRIFPLLNHVSAFLNACFFFYVSYPNKCITRVNTLRSLQSVNETQVRGIFDNKIIRVLAMILAILSSLIVIIIIMLLINNIKIKDYDSIFICFIKLQ